MLIDLLVQTEQPLESLAIAKCLKALYDDEKPDVILMGKQAIDGDNNQTGNAGSLLVCAGTFASDVCIEGGKITVTREIDGGLQTRHCLCRL